MEMGRREVEASRGVEREGRCEDFTVGSKTSGIQPYHARMSSRLQSTLTFNKKGINSCSLLFAVQSSCSSAFTFSFGCERKDNTEVCRAASC